MTTHRLPAVCAACVVAAASLLTAQTRPAAVQTTRIYVFEDASTSVTLHRPAKRPCTDRRRCVAPTSEEGSTDQWLRVRA
jgi:hypothetical protein